jgi:hypothetical protein
MKDCPKKVLLVPGGRSVEDYLEGEVKPSRTTFKLTNS